MSPLPRRTAGGIRPLPKEIREVQIRRQAAVESSFIFCTGASLQFTRICWCIAPTLGKPLPLYFPSVPS